MSTPADVLLSRLVNVRRFGNGWRADCPVGHSSRGSLSIGERDDGAVMLHCFAGCSAADVVDAAGLTLADLFPESTRSLSPLGRAQRREAAQVTNAAAAVNVIGFEASIVLIAAGDAAAGKALADADRERLTQAVDCIDAARSVLTGRKIEARDYRRVVDALHLGAEQANADAERWAASRRGEVAA